MKNTAKVKLMYKIHYMVKSLKDKQKIVKFLLTHTALSYQKPNVSLVATWQTSVSEQRVKWFVLKNLKRFVGVFV